MYQIKEEIEDKSLQYPSYYTVPFHGAPQNFGVVAHAQLAEERGCTGWAAMCDRRVAACKRSCCLVIVDMR